MFSLRVFDNVLNLLPLNAAYKKKKNLFREPQTEGSHPSVLWVLCPLALPPIIRVVTSLCLGLSPTEDVTGGMKFKVLSEAVPVQFLRKKLANDFDDITGD